MPLDEGETVAEFIQRVMAERGVTADDKEFGEILWSAVAAAIVTYQDELEKGDVHLISLADIFNRYYAIRRRYREEFEESYSDEGIRNAYSGEDLPRVADAHAKLVQANNIMTFYTICYELADSLMEDILPNEILHPEYIEVPAARDVFESKGYHDKRLLLRAIGVTDTETHNGLDRIGTVRGDFVHDMSKRMTGGDLNNVEEELLLALKTVNNLFEMVYGNQAFRIRE